MTTESPPTESTGKNVKIEEGEQPSKEFLEIFEQLDPNINGELIEKAWKLYDTISQQVNIDLERSKKVWMACAFYTTVWTSTPIGQETVYKYSVSKLLSICNLSVLEFFDKLNKWAAMIVASRRLLDHLNRVQSNLAVTTVVYKKFLPIFRKVFVNLNDEEPKTKSKYATQLFASIDITQIFELIWMAFIALKKQLGTANEDLMHSYHLILSIIELIFENIQAAGLKRFYNADFG